MNKYLETLKTWNKIAEIYQDRFMDLDLYNDTYDYFLNIFPRKNAYVLDIGCGPGNITKYLLAQNPRLEIKGIDISEQMIKLAGKNNPSAEFEVMDSRELNKLNDKFDAIISGFCIPYLSRSDCKKLIRDCKNLLTDSGILYLSFVEGDYRSSGFISRSSKDRIYFYYHSLNTLQKELKTNNFGIKKSLKNYQKADGTEEIHTIIILRKLKG